MNQKVKKQKISINYQVMLTAIPNFYNSHIKYKEGYFQTSMLTVQ